MQFKLAVLIVGVYLITMTSQKKNHSQYFIHKKKCDEKHISFRIKILDFVIKVNQFFGLPTKIKMKICETNSTTTTTTTIPITTTTVTTTTACTSMIPLGKTLGRNFLFTLPNVGLIFQWSCIDCTTL